MFARSRLAAGTRIKLTVVYQSDHMKLEGSVLRCDELEPGASTLWRTTIAIAVDADDPVLPQLYAAIAAGSEAS